MSLSSIQYLLLFLPLAVLVVGLARARGSTVTVQASLLALSLVFVGLDSALSAALLVVSVGANWTFARLLTTDGVRERTRTMIATGGIATNVAVLALFKYRGLHALSTVLPMPSALANLTTIPLGLSFYTITQVMYVVDCYQGVIRTQSALSYASFATLFTNVTAGPILRWRHYVASIPTLGARGASGSTTDASTAILLIGFGLLKKLALGNTFAEMRRIGFENPAALTIPDAWISVIAGTFEVYFDFSGYSDIAMGSAMLLGFPIKRNFDAPFRSSSISEFWRRWHISLSEFITTYLYTPILRRLGKVSLAKSAVASVLAMLIAGLWHGATWNYLLFGLLHGVALAAYQYWKKAKRPLPDAVGVPLTFVYVAIAFALVHAADLSSFGAMIGRLVTGPLDGRSVIVEHLRQQSLDRLYLPPVLVGSVVAFAGPTAEECARRVRARGWMEPVLLAIVLATYLFGGVGGNVDFRYRQF